MNDRLAEQAVDSSVIHTWMRMMVDPLKANGRADEGCKIPQCDRSCKSSVIAVSKQVRDSNDRRIVHPHCIHSVYSTEIGLNFGRLGWLANHATSERNSPPVDRPLGHRGPVEPEVSGSVYEQRSVRAREGGGGLLVALVEFGDVTGGLVQQVEAEPHDPIGDPGPVQAGERGEAFADVGGVTEGVLDVFG